MDIGDLKSGEMSSRKNDEIVVLSRFDTLPEDCISMVISQTSPRDACVVASVSKIIKSAAQSDLVWETFLPPEYSYLSANYSSKKELYLSLANDSVLIDDGKKSFWLEKSTGKKCYMLSAMDLIITWGDSPAYWQWIKVPESKFEKVAELRNVCWFEIRGKISCGMLSKGTHYSVYAVFKRSNNRSYGFDYAPVEGGVGFVGKEATKTLVFLESPGSADDDYSRSGYSGISHVAVTRAFRMRRPWMRIPRGEHVEDDKENVEEPMERGDGWSEVEIGKFYIDNDGDSNDDDDDEIEISIMETQMGHWKSGLIIQGIEIRPERRRRRRN